MTPSYLREVANAFAGGNSPSAVGYNSTLGVGSFVVLLLGDGFGWPSTPTAVTDTAGNIYTLDSNVNEADGDGSAYVASCHLTNAVGLGDFIEIAFTNAPWNSATAVAFAFDAVARLDTAGTPVGDYANAAPVALSPSVPVVAGELAIGFAVYQDPDGAVINDPAWVPLTPGPTAQSENTIVAGYRLATIAAVLTYNTTAVSRGYSASVALAYAPGPGAGPTHAPIQAGPAAAGLLRL